MPHFVIDCSEKIITLRSAEEIMGAVHDTAEETSLFSKGDIKVRINPFTLFNTGNTKHEFIHVFGYIMEGRNIAQKKDLSKKIISKLKQMFPDVPVISMNVTDFEKASYCNKNMV